MRSHVQTDTLAFLAADIARMLRGAMERRIATSNVALTPGEARTLAFAARMDEPPQARLANHMCVDPMTVSGYIAKLEELGLIERRSRPDDRRVKQIGVTEKADAVLRFLKAETDSLERQACDGLDDSERSMLFRLLTRIRSNLVAETGAACAPTR